jgi:hypothetical protein
VADSLTLFSRKCRSGVRNYLVDHEFDDMNIFWKAMFVCEAPFTLARNVTIPHVCEAGDDFCDASPLNRPLAVALPTCALFLFGITLTKMVRPHIVCISASAFR